MHTYINIYRSGEDVFDIQVLSEVDEDLGI